MPWPGSSSSSSIDSARNAITLAKAAFTTRFDVIHSFSRVAYLAPLLPLPVPKLMTYQREVTPRSVRLAHSLSRGTLWFTAISHSLVKPVTNVGTWRVVYNGVRTDLYEFRADPGPNAPLVFWPRRGNKGTASRH